MGDFPNHKIGSAKRNVQWILSTYSQYLDKKFSPFGV